MIKLDIGCGEYPIPGFEGVDPYIESATYKCNMWSTPFDESSVDEIFSSHALEHIPTKMVIPTLSEWKRIIKPNGKITIRVPDLEWCVNRWLKTRGTGWDLAIIFGNQNHDGEFHKTGFTKAIMIHYLSKVGLRITTYETLFTHEQQTLSFEVTKE